MKKTLLELYALAVCFATVVCSTVVFGVMLWHVVKIAQPEFTIRGYVYQRHQDNEEFRKFGNDCAIADADAAAAAAAAHAANTTGSGERRPEKSCAPPSEAEITAKREASWAREVRQERREGLQTLVLCLLLLLVNLSVFLPHWILAKRTRAQAPA